jgi:hypothetical protein
MTLDASGNLMVGTTTANGKISLYSTSNVTMSIDGTGRYKGYELYASGALKAYFNIDSTSSITAINSTYGTLTFGTGDTERARIDSSGNFLVGGTSAFSSDTGRGNISINGASTSILALGVAASQAGYLFHDGTNMNLFNDKNGYLRFATNGTERARIDSSGNLLVGTTSDGAGLGYATRIAVDGGGGEASVFKTSAGGSAFCARMWNSATSGNNLFIDFQTEAGGTERGFINYNRAGGLVAYNTTSDYRAKDISGPVINSGALIDSVPVYMGTMKGATQERPMFIAHEVPAYAHTGEKDAVDADGNPVYQQMDASALIPVMWAEIQSLRQRLSAANL